MTHYDHATQIAFRLGPWASPCASERSAAAHEIEAALAEARHTSAEAASSQRGPGPIAALLNFFSW
ncbi:MAG: hypothetical protein AAFU80_16610 [Pseudomonadota bacterium]